MKKPPVFAILLYFLLSYTVTFATDISSTSTGWQEGVIVLHDKTVLQGTINYDYRYDVVMYRKAGKIITFTPLQVASFCYFDPKTNIFHRYMTLARQKTAYTERQTIFEIVLKGTVQYLRRHNQYPPVISNDQSHASDQPFYQEQIVCYDYYILYQDQLIKSRRFQQEVLPQLAAVDHSLMAYIKDQRLQTGNVGDQIRLIRYFNASKKSGRYAAL